MARFRDGESEGRVVRRMAALAGVLTIGAVAFAIILINVFQYANWADALSYAEGARRIYAGVSPYSAFQLAGPYLLDSAAYGEGFVYPPTGAYLLVPFVLGTPFWTVWNVCSIGAVIGVFVLIVRRELGRLTPAWTLGAAAVGMVIFMPGLNELVTGYLSAMVAAGIGCMWLWPRWSAIPALGFGLIKAFPSIGLIWTIRKGGVWKLPLAIAVGIGFAVTVIQPSFTAEWVLALVNAKPACPAFALPSFGCLGVPVLGFLLAAILAVAGWRTARDDVAFLLIGLAMTIPLPDLYWGNLMVPIMASVPLVIRLLRPLWVAGEVGQYAANSRTSRSASSME